MERNLKWTAKQAQFMALNEHKENKKRLKWVKKFNKISPRNFATNKTAQVLLRDYVKECADMMQTRGAERYNVYALHGYLQPMNPKEWGKNKGKKVDDAYKRTMMTHCYLSFLDLYKEVFGTDDHPRDPNILASEPRGAAESSDEDNNSDEFVSEDLDDDKNKEADDDKELSESFENKCVVKDNKEKIEQLEEKIKKLEEENIRLREKIKKLEEENKKIKLLEEKIKKLEEENIKKAKKPSFRTLDCRHGSACLYLRSPLGCGFKHTAKEVAEARQDKND